MYGRSWRIWQQMGGKRMITYTLQKSLDLLYEQLIEDRRQTKVWKEGTGWATRPVEIGNLYTDNKSLDGKYLNEIRSLK